MMNKYEQRKPSGGKPYGGYQQRAQELPPECIFRDTFYERKYDCLKKGVFIDAAETAAKVFGREMSQSSIRSAFQTLKVTAKRIKTEKLDDCQVNNDFYKFVTYCEYQNRRKAAGKAIVPDSFLKFVKEHTKVVESNKNEFLGFLEYLTSILARMKTKQR